MLPQFGEVATPSNIGYTLPEGPSREARIPKKVWQLWHARVEYAKECAEENQKEYEEAERFYRGGEGEWDADDTKVTDIRISANTFHRDVNILIAHLLASDPRIRGRARKNKRYTHYAAALTELANYAYEEEKWRYEVSKALKEAIFRNNAFLRLGWDSYRWLPTLQWCEEPVYLDPDCGGDIRRSNYVIERWTARLDDILTDESIDPEIRKELKERKGITLSSQPRKKPATVGQTPKYGPSVWENQPGFTKVTAWRIHSREGMYPFGVLGADDGRAPGQGGIDSSAGRDGSMKDFWLPPEYGTRRKPKPQGSDPVDMGRRVYILLIEGYDKIVKVGPWELDYFDREEFPYIHFSLNRIPGDLYGVSLFKILKPLLKAKNWLLSFFMNRQKAVARSLLVGRKELFDSTEQEKLARGKMFEVVWSNGPGNLEPIDMVSKGTEHLAVADIIDREHDRVSGINDIVRGEAGETTKTASEANMLADQAEAAWSALNEAVEMLHVETARHLVMAIQRYFRGRSEYVPCPDCGSGCQACQGRGCEDCNGLGLLKGNGTQPGEQLLAAAIGETEPMSQQCGLCGGSGWRPNAPRMRIGADRYISPELAGDWIDDVPLEDIRCEIQVHIEPGSARRDYRERRVGLISTIMQRAIPIFQQYSQFDPSIHARILRLTSESVLATEIPGAEDWVPTEAEIDGIAQKAAEMAAAQQPPSPEQQQAMAQEQAAAQAQAQEQAKGQQATQQAEAQMQAQAQSAQVAQLKLQGDLQKMQLEHAFELEKLRQQSALSMQEQVAVAQWKTQAEATSQGNTEATVASGAAQIAEIGKGLVGTLTQLAAVMQALSERLGTPPTAAA